MRSIYECDGCSAEVCDSCSDGGECYACLDKAEAGEPTPNEAWQRSRRIMEALPCLPEMQP